MARYRHKSEEDLAWNKVRRRLTAELDAEVRDVREEILNMVLAKAWEEFTTSLGQGKLPEIEGRYTDLVKAVMRDAIPRLVEASGVEDPLD